MAITNHERVGKALELLKAGLGPFVEREIKSAIAPNTISMARVREFLDDPKLGNKSISDWDAAALLKLMGDTWNDVFRKTLGQEAEIPEGAPDQVVRTVTENSQTLKFASHGFERE